MLRKGRKKGSIIVEFLVVMPIFLLLVWGIFQSMLYMITTATLHEAAMESARVASMELRQVGTGYPSETSKANIIKEKMIFKSYNITNNNHFIMLFTDGDGSTSNPDVIIKPGITSNPDNDCSTELATNSRGRVICTYITTYSSANGVREQQQVVVKIKAKFFVVGSFIPSLKTIPIRGVGSSQIELTDAFQYQTVPTRTFSG